MLEAGLIVSRFLHYAVVLALFGMALLPLYAYPKRAGLVPARLFQWIVLGAAVASLLAAILWLAFTTANMSGNPIGAVDWDALAAVLRDTGFGHLWIVRLALTIVIIGLGAAHLASKVSDRRDVVTPLLAGALLASLAATGHTQHEEGLTRLVHEGADGAHLLAAGAWLGGLLGLSFILALASRGAGQPVEKVLLGFSGMGYVAVALLVASGLINSWFLVGSFRALVATTYGQLLIVKLCLFAGMVALAASNRFWLVPELIRESETGGPRASLVRLRRNVLGEQSLGLIIVLVVSVLGTMEPAATQMSP